MRTPDHTREAIQRHIGGCREWLLEEVRRCNQPAEYVLWGKLIPADGLGPRCAEHAAQYVGWSALNDDAWAIIDVAKLANAIERSA